MHCPKPLFPGARVALVAPASAVPEEKRQPALDYVSSLGLEPVVYPSCYFINRDGYLAANDAQRAKDLNDAFSDPSIDGIWCIRGGYGGHRILPLLDAEGIRKNPKWFGGYSDVTAIFEQLIAPAGKPCITDVACGHILPTLSLPMGRICTLDADHCTIVLE